MRYVNRKNEITISRGDTETITLYIFYDTDSCIFLPDSFDKVFFGLMEANQEFEQAIVKKVYDGTIVSSDDEKVIIKIKLESIDTEFLNTGVYFYTIKTLLKNSPEEEDTLGTVKTLIDRTKFVIID